MLNRVISERKLLQLPRPRCASETTYLYDLAGNRVSLTDPESNETTWEYNSLHLVSDDHNELMQTASTRTTWQEISWK